MPFTPFHFGPSATVAIPLYRRLDVFTFIFANIIIDIEPLIVLTYNLNCRVHGYTHTFIGAALLGAATGMVCWIFRAQVKKIVVDILKFPFEASKSRMIISGILGAVFHVLLDSPLYTDIKPFYPISVNPMYGIIGYSSMYILCSLLFIPAIILYAYRITRKQ